MIALGCRAHFTRFRHELFHALRVVSLAHRFPSSFGGDNGRRRRENKMAGGVIGMRLGVDENPDWL